MHGYFKFPIVTAAIAYSPPRVMKEPFHPIIYRCVSQLASTRYNSSHVLLIPIVLQILPPPPSITSASTRYFDFIGGTVVTLFGQNFEESSGFISFGSSYCVFKMLGSDSNITVLGEVLDSSSVRCQATPVNADTLESGGLFGAPFQKWNVHVVLADGRKSSSNVFIETQCKNATRFLNSSQLLCSRCPPFSFSIQPDAPLCLCEKGSFGTHPACRRCPKVVGFDCSRDNMTSVGKFELNTASACATLNV
jgi:hypothetical protein